jgi:hypothetical protein
VRETERVQAVLVAALARLGGARATVAMVLAETPAPATEDRQAAAGAALDDNTPEALRHFLEVGQYEVG